MDIVYFMFASVVTVADSSFKNNVWSAVEKNPFESDFVFSIFLHYLLVFLM